MLTIPTTAVPAQTFGVSLGGQDCRLTVYQKSTGLFLDLTVSGAVIMTGVICRDRTRLVRQPYLGFIGDLAFFDTLGKTDPVSTGLGAQYQLIYLEAADVSALA